MSEIALASVLVAEFSIEEGSVSLYLLGDF
jgi:hypothetical protein